MKLKNWPLVVILSLSTVFIVACGEDDAKDSRITDAEAMCLKIVARGGTCNNGTAGGTSTQTQTVTVTQTQTN